jgi:hypothetical protein
MLYDKNKNKTKEKQTRGSRSRNIDAYNTDEKPPSHLMRLPRKPCFNIIGTQKKKKTKTLDHGPENK